MATTIGSAAFKLSADSAAFEADVKRATKAAERMSATLEKQIAVFGKTASEAKAYELSQRGVDAELLASISALESQKKSLADQSAAVDRGKAIFDATRTAEEKYKAEISNLNGLLMRGALSFDTYNRAVKKAGENLPSVKKATEDAARAQREHDAVMQRGKAVFDSTRTASEKYEAEVRDLDDLLKRGAIDQETFNRAVRRGEMEMKNAAGASDKLSAKGLLGGGIKAGIAGIAAALTVRKGIQFGRESIALYEDQIAQERKLAGVIRATGGAAGFTAQELANYASELQSATGIGDEVFLQAQTALATFRKVGGDAFKQATELAVDMSLALGTDAKGAALQLGKALNDPILGLTALRRAGVSFDEQQKATIRSMVAMNDIAGAQAIILKELENEFGGVARNSKSSSGALSTSWDDVKEGIGAVIVESNIFKGTSDFLTETFSKLASDLRIVASGTLNYVGETEKLSQAERDATAAAEEEAKAIEKLAAAHKKEMQAREERALAYDKEQRNKFVEELGKPSGKALELQEKIKLFGLDGVEEFIAAQKHGVEPAMAKYLRDLEAQLKALEAKRKAEMDAADAAKRAAEEQVRAQEEIANEGKRVFDATRTEAEKYQAELANLDRLLKAGAISQDTFNRAATKAGEAFFGMDKGEKKAEFQAPAALLAGSQGALSAINRFQGGQGGSTEEKSLEELREMKRLQAEQLKELRRRNAGLEVAKLAP